MPRFEDIKGFAFDLDGVITDTARLHGQAWRQTADTVGTPWTAELAESLKGISRLESLEMILAAGGHANDYTEREKEALADEKNEAYQELIKTLTPADILPGMGDFIRDAVAQGYRLSIASASKNAPAILNNLGLTKYFIGIVDPATLSAGKPDPEIFVRAAAVLDLPNEQIIGLEDSAAGIKSINATGQTSLGIAAAGVLPEAKLHFTATSQVTLATIATKMNQ